ncbi:branched-chain amino acid aminotransferase [Cytobacillus massiliigabonensis]|uniref:branched-chain amino acid aminotransferase n=1 Tax=Cytobacillus massiliigabonensis TaxID=1871011 RepID=UPI000C824BEF|nr:branched-chain amino acid aminotransferase [Cytobacillus massiliigabonensis]
MLNTKITNYFSDEKTKAFKEEIEYARKHELIDETRTIIEIDPVARFNDAYIERSDKETEEFLGEESASFLNQPIHYFKKNLNEFIYIESAYFPMIHAESICLEVDDIFRTYEVMLGLKLQKKYEKEIKAYLEQELIGKIKVSLLFNQTDGLWDFNFALNNVKGFNEDLTIGEVLVLVYRFLFKLAETVEENK